MACGGKQLRAAGAGELLTIRGRGPVTLVVGNDVAAVIAEDAYTAVGRSQIDTNRGSHFGCVCGNLTENEKKKMGAVPGTFYAVSGMSMKLGLESVQLQERGEKKDRRRLK